MTSETTKIEVRNKGLVIFGVALLVVGLVAYFYYESRTFLGIEYQRVYPYQNVGLLLIVVGIVLAALGFFYPLGKVELTKQNT